MSYNRNPQILACFRKFNTFINNNEQSDEEKARSAIQFLNTQLLELGSDATEAYAYIIRQQKFLTLIDTGAEPESSFYRILDEQAEDILKISNAKLQVTAPLKEIAERQQIFLETLARESQRKKDNLTTREFIKNAIRLFNKTLDNHCIGLLKRLH